MGKGRDSVIKFMREKVIQVPTDADNTALAAASPINHLHSNCPPMFIIHGKPDSLLCYEEAEDFVHAAHEQSIEQIQLHLVEGAQHAFEIFYTPATFYFIHTVCAYLNQQLALHSNNLNE